jgi:hypothetical protein
MVFTSEKVGIYAQKKSDIDHSIVYDWFEDTFLPELVVRRTQYDYHGSAFLIMDNCTAHTGDDFQAMCDAAEVVLIVLPPHSSNPGWISRGGPDTCNCRKFQDRRDLYDDGH